ncbi:MAG: hypothetical protein QM775_07270 [Pirellulales bacterium]
MIAGTTAVYEQEIRRAVGEQNHKIDDVTTPDYRDVSTDWESLERQAADLRVRIVQSAKVFLHRCHRLQLIDTSKFIELQERLGVAVGTK